MISRHDSMEHSWSNKRQIILNIKRDIRVLRKIYWKRCNPDWTEQENKACGARDELEIETSSETILADLRQGINNQTRLARYHWVIKKIYIINQNRGGS